MQLPPDQRPPHNSPAPIVVGLWSTERWLSWLNYLLDNLESTATILAYLFPPLATVIVPAKELIKLVGQISRYTKDIIFASNGTTLWYRLVNAVQLWIVNLPYLVLNKVLSYIPLGSVLFIDGIRFSKEQFRAVLGGGTQNLAVSLLANLKSVYDNWDQITKALSSVQAFINEPFTEAWGYAKILIQEAISELDVLEFGNAPDVFYPAPEVPTDAPFPGSFPVE